MKDKELSGPNHSTMDPSGLRSANELSGDLSDKGWGGLDAIPGVGSGAEAPIRTSSREGFSPNDQPVGGPPPASAGDADDIDIPLQRLMNVGDEPGPVTGDSDGVRSAVGSSFTGG